MSTEADEVRELRKMFKSPSRGRGIHNRPPWNGTPLRNRPSQLRGLKPVTPEPWKIDEDYYNARFETRDVDEPDRYLDKTARKRFASHLLVDYRARFDAKYGAPQRHALNESDPASPSHPRPSTPRAARSRDERYAQQVRRQPVHLTSTSPSRGLSLSAPSSLASIPTCAWILLGHEAARGISVEEAQALSLGCATPEG